MIKKEPPNFRMPTKWLKFSTTEVVYKLIIGNRIYSIHYFYNRNHTSWVRIHASGYIDKAIRLWYDH